MLKFYSYIPDIPNNMTQEQQNLAILGAISFSMSALLYYFVFGKLVGRKSLVKLIGGSKFDTTAAIWAILISGVVFSSAFIKQLNHQHYIDFNPFDSKQFINKTSEGTLVVAGLLVGIGITLAGGCTFGHLVTGIARTQKASFLATFLFVGTAYLTNRYRLASKIPYQLTRLIRVDLPNNISGDYYINLCLVIPFATFVIFKDKSLKGLIKYILNFLIGILCGLGMMIGGLTKRQLVLQAINYKSTYWNPSMVLFYGITIILCTIGIKTIINKKVTPVFTTAVQNPPQVVNSSLVVGAILFGIGWGLAGLCPGPFYAMAPMNNFKVPLYWGVPYLLGLRLGTFVEFLLEKLRRITNPRAS